MGTTNPINILIGNKFLRYQENFIVENKIQYRNKKILTFKKIQKKQLNKIYIIFCTHYCNKNIHCYEIIKFIFL